MKQVSKALGLVGGIGGTVLSVLILFVLWLRRFFGRARAGERVTAGVSAWSFFVLIFAVAGIVGAELVTSKPKAGGILALIGGSGIVLAILAGGLVAGRIGIVELIEAAFALLLLAAGILGIIASRPQKPKPLDGSATGPNSTR